MEETKGEMTAEEYKEYYKTGYETDIVSVNIKGNNIEYTYEDGRKVNSDYKYTGYYIQVWSGGTMAALYRFEAENKDSGAPVYIEINDHMIEPAKAEHFHLRMSNESFDAIKDPEKYWPTFFPADCDHFSGGHKHDEDNHEEDHDHEHHHDHEEGEVEYDEHVWLSLKNAAVLTAKLSESTQTLDPANKDVYKKNADAYIENLDNSINKSEHVNYHEKYTNSKIYATSTIYDEYNRAYWIDKPVPDAKYFNHEKTQVTSFALST